jgi:hypothetical protein
MVGGGAILGRSEGGAGMFVGLILTLGSFGVVLSAI